MHNTRRLMMNILISLLIMAAVLWGLVRYLESHAIFFPSKNITTDPSVIGLPFDDLYLTTVDGVKINAWFVKGEARASTIIFAHGNAGTMSDRLLKLKFFHELGLNVLLFDYRGYGLSGGVPSEKGIYLDGATVYDYAVSRADVDPARIIMYGTSLGGIVAVDVASKRPCAALIVDSSITSAKEAARVFYPLLPSIFLSTKFDSIGKIKSIKIPKLIIHSPQDQVVPYAMGKRLYEAASEPKTFLRSSGGHNEAQIVSDKQTGEAFAQFLRAHHLL